MPLLVPSGTGGLISMSRLWIIDAVGNLRRQAVAISITGGIAATVFVGQGSAQEVQRQGDSSSPRVVQLWYFEQNRDDKPPRGAAAFVRRARAVRFATRFDGERAMAPGREGTIRPPCGPDCREWGAIRREGGREVLRLIHQSLEHTGKAKVRVRARGQGELDDVFLLLRDSKCAHNPPTFSRTCAAIR
jgi:hypothetical protein